MAILFLLSLSLPGLCPQLLPSILHTGKPVDHLSHLSSTYAVSLLEQFLVAQAGLKLVIILLLSLEGLD